MAEYPWFPLFVNLAGKRIVVVGGGRIALRRIRVLAEFTENITVIAPELHPELLSPELAGKLRVLQRAYAPGDLEGADLVLAATDDPAVDRAVREECLRLGVPVNVAGDRSLSDFFFPGIARRDNVVVGVTAGGKDHAEARRVTEQVRELLEKTGSGQ